MQDAAGGLLGAVLIVIAAVHFYWAAGGEWGVDATIPRRSKGGARLFQPGKAGAAGVGMALVAAGTVAARGLEFEYRPAVLQLMSLGFAARAVGEFRYVGFFKRVKGSKFAYYDSILFSPLCAAMSALAWVSVG